MYKFLVIGVSLFVVGGAGYYFNSSHGSDLLVQAISQSDPSNAGVSIAEVYSGTYNCNPDSGCQRDTSFVLHDDTSLEIVSIVEGESTQLGQGTWGVGGNGTLVLLVQPVNQAGQQPSFSLIAKKLSTLKISDFSNKKNLYPWMNNPVFTRVAQ